MGGQVNVKVQPQKALLAFIQREAWKVELNISLCRFDYDQLGFMRLLRLTIVHSLLSSTQQGFVEGPLHVSGLVIPILICHHNCAWQLIEVNEAERRLILSEKQAVLDQSMRLVEMGAVYDGKVNSVTDFGAFVDLVLPNGMWSQNSFLWYTHTYQSISCQELLGRFATFWIVHPSSYMLSLDYHRDIICKWASTCLRNFLGSRAKPS